MPYAHIANAKVVEIFTPPPGMSMSQLFHPNLIWVDITGRNPQPQPGWNAIQQSGAWVLTPPVAVPLTPAQLAQQALASGVAVESNSTPDLNGVYAIDAESRTDIMAEMLSLSGNQTFTNGNLMIDWPDVGMKPHTFDVTQFHSFATALGNYITSLKQVMA